MSGLPMSADQDHVFSSAPRKSPSQNTAGMLRDRKTAERGAVYFTARKCFGATGEWATLEEPRCVEVALWPTQEAAEAYALALNTWLDARPDPSTVAPFFNPVVRVEPSYEGLLGIFERMLRPETKGLGSE